MFFSSPTPGVNTSTAVNRVTETNMLSVYPNPASGRIVRLNKRINCRVYNSSGILVFSGEEVETLDISGYLPGLYFIVSDDGSGTKLVVY
ncbi:MAG: T9SS type A sorting domain-containing protein [Bacteroidales bacterium]